MNQDKRKKLAALVMIVALTGFFVSFAFFDLFGTKIDYANPAYMLLKVACGFGFIVLGLFAGMYLYGGKQLAVRVAGRLAAALVIAYLLGFALHR